MLDILTHRIQQNTPITVPFMLLTISNDGCVQNGNTL